MSIRSLHVAAGLASALLSSSCFSFHWTRATKEMPPVEAEFEGLEPGRSDLALCLERLGAPSHVWEFRGDGIALAYGSFERRDMGFGVSIPVIEFVNASYDFTDVDRRTEGWLLVFDGDWRLESVRRGHLRSLTSGLRTRRPAPVDPEDEPGGSSAPSGPVPEDGDRIPGNSPRGRS